MTSSIRLTPFDAQGSFRPTGGDVRRLAIRGAGVTVFSSGLSLIIQIVATTVLARVLSPKDFGLVAIVTTFSLLLTNFGLNGLTEAVLQREEMNDALASNLFWIMLGGGTLLTLAFAAAGSLFARFYHDPTVQIVTVALSPTILLTSLSVIHLALLRRAMRFSVVSANDVVAKLFSVITSIALGFAGWGYWALIIGVISTSLITGLGAVYLCRWTPGRPRPAPGMASVLYFAANTYARFSVNYFARNIDNFLVGWQFGANALGFYKKAYDLFALSASQLTAPLSNVAVAGLSRSTPRSPEFRRNLLGAISVTAFVGMALSGEFTLIGKDLIRLLLGPNWGAAGEIFTFFGPGIGIMLVYITQGWIHLSIGKADRWLRWGIVEVVVTCSLFFLALPYGPVGIAVAWTVSFWILSIPAFWYAGKPIDFGVGPIIECVWRFILASLLAASVSAFLMSKMPSLELAQGVSAAATRLAIVSVVFTTLYLAAVVALYRGFAPLYQIAKLLREMLPSRRAAASMAPAEAPLVAVGAGGPLVSILIPAHNAQEWIADTLRSALAQTWQNKEIIVVDDGSSDRTAEIVRQFALQGVRIVSQNNEGASAARNHAFSLSRGEFIQWLDADDLLAPNKIAVQMQAASQFPRNRTLLSSAWGKFMYRYYRAEFSPSDLWCDLSPVEWLLRKMGQNLYMQTATWLVSRDLAEAAGPWDTRLLGDDDGEYFCRVLMASEGVHFVPEAKVCYRGPGLAFRSLSYIGRSNQKRDAHWLSMQLHIKYLRSLEDSERARTACLRYLQTSLIYFYPEEIGIIAQADQLARELGGELVSPRLSWKYAWMKSMFGWDIAKRGQLFLLSIKWWGKRYWDKTLFRLDNLGTRTAWPPHAIVRDPTQRS